MNDSGMPPQQPSPLPPAETAASAERVANAVSFLTHPNALSAPMSRKVAFLKHKGLSDAEVDEALRKAGQHSTTPPDQRVLPTAPVGSSAVVMPVTSPRPWTWWGYAILAAAVAAIFAAAAAAYKAYVRPWIEARERKRLEHMQRMEELAAKTHSEISTLAATLNDTLGSVADAIAENTKEASKMRSQIEAQQLADDHARTLREELTSLRSSVVSLNTTNTMSQSSSAVPSSDIAALASSSSSKAAVESNVPGRTFERGAVAAGVGVGAAAATAAAGGTLGDGALTSTTFTGVGSWQLENGTMTSASSTGSSGVAIPKWQAALVDADGAGKEQAAEAAEGPEITGVGDESDKNIRTETEKIDAGGSTPVDDEVAISSSSELTKDGSSLVGSSDFGLSSSEGGAGLMASEKGKIAQNDATDASATSSALLGTSSGAFSSVVEIDTEGASQQEAAGEGAVHNDRDDHGQNSSEKESGGEPVEGAAGRYPKSFMDVMKMMQSGEKIEVQDVDDTPVEDNADVPISGKPPPKPWEITRKIGMEDQSGDGEAELQDHDAEPQGPDASSAEN